MEKLKVAVLDMQPITPAIGGGRIRLLGLYSGMEKDMRSSMSDLMIGVGRNTVRSKRQII